MKKKVIAICASASHYRQAIDIAEGLKSLGYTVILPKVANIMKKNNNYDVSFYKTWFSNKNDYKKKTQYVKEHFRKIIKSDAVLVTNFEKNKIKGYIGGNVLMELTIAFHYKKPIYILNEISKDLSILEEIYALEAKFIDRDLRKIKI